MGDRHPRAARGATRSAVEEGGDVTKPPDSTSPRRCAIAFASRVHTPFIAVLQGRAPATSR